MQVNEHCLNVLSVGSARCGTYGRQFVGFVIPLCVLYTPLCNWLKLQLHWPKFTKTELHVKSRRTYVTTRNECFILLYKMKVIGEVNFAFVYPLAVLNHFTRPLGGSSCQHDSNIYLPYIPHGLRVNHQLLIYKSNRDRATSTFTWSLASGCLMIVTPALTLHLSQFWSSRTPEGNNWLFSC